MWKWKRDEGSPDASWRLQWGRTSVSRGSSAGASGQHVPSGVRCLDVDSLRRTEGERGGGNVGFEPAAAPEALVHGVARAARPSMSTRRERSSGCTGALMTSRVSRKPGEVAVGSFLMPGTEAQVLAVRLSSNLQSSDLQLSDLELEFDQSSSDRARCGPLR